MTRRKQTQGRPRRKGRVRVEPVLREEVDARKLVAALLELARQDDKQRQAASEAEQREAQSLSTQPSADQHNREDAGQDE